MAMKVVWLSEENINWLKILAASPNKGITFLREGKVDTSSIKKIENLIKELDERESKIEEVIERLVQVNHLRT